MTDGYIGIITKWIYGISGNELPPPVINKIKRAIMFPGASKEDAIKQMQIIGMYYRNQKSVAEPYSQEPGYDWEVIPIASNFDDPGSDSNHE